MVSPVRYIPDAVFLVLAVWLQWRLAGWALEMPRFQGSRPGRLAIRGLAALACIWIVAPALYTLGAVLGWWPHSSLVAWVRGASILWAIVSAGLVVLVWLNRQAPPFDPRRRRLLAVSRAALFAAPFAVAGTGVAVGRASFQFAEVEVPIPDLPPDLDGLRIVHLSDIHLEPFLTDEELRRVVAMANETRAHLAVVTGDLITLHGDKLSDCLRILSGLRADAGILGCLGNHEIVGRCQNRAESEGRGLGIDFLRGASRQLRFGQAVLNVGGVDYQRRERPYLIGAEQMVRRGEVNLLLSHNPDVFPVAARQGWDLTLAGHTHGGQLTFGPLHQHLNLARLFTPYVYGLYREDRSSIYVTRGIGTVGVPARIGAPPEIALVKLCAT